MRAITGLDPDERTVVVAALLRQYRHRCADLRRGRLNTYQAERAADEAVTAYGLLTRLHHDTTDLPDIPSGPTTTEGPTQ